MNDENLKNGIKFGTDEKATRQAAINGGKKSGESRRLQAAMRDLLDQDVTLDGVKQLLKDMKIDKTDRRWSKALAAAMLKKACEGDKQCADWVRDTAGEKPTDKQEIDVGHSTLEAIEDMSVDAKRKALDDLISKVGGSE